jgi:hypothetical protein
MNRIQIKYGVTIKPAHFVKSNLTGIARLRTKFVITDNEEYPLSNYFNHIYIPEQKITDDLFKDNVFGRLLVCNYAEDIIVIGCANQQWSYLLFVALLMSLGNIPSFEHIAVALKQCIDSNDNLEAVNLNTLNHMATIISNYSVYDQLTEGTIVSPNAEEDESLRRLYDEEYDKHTLMLALVFSENLNTDAVPIFDIPKEEHEFDNTITNDSVRPPMPIYRGVLAGDVPLERIDPGVTMVDTSNEKPKPPPSMADCLGITSYSGYEPIPDEEEVRDQLTSISELERRLRDLHEMMGGRIYNKAYAQNLLHSGMTAEEVFSLLILSV